MIVRITESARSVIFKSRERNIHEFYGIYRTDCWSFGMFNLMKILNCDDVEFISVEQWDETRKSTKASKGKAKGKAARATRQSGERGRAR